MTELFKAWPKTPRFEESKLVFTEKIDGTNSCIIFDDEGKLSGVQSRNRMIVPGDDNYGFAKWVHENQEELSHVLGPGYHYGEWWGQGIRRGYGMDRKVFSLFNVGRWGNIFNLHPDKTLVDAVPSMEITLEEGASFDEVLDRVKEYFLPSSWAASKYNVDYRNPEGFMMYHARSEQLYKFPINK